jgi:hypothetical protein
MQSIDTALAGEKYLNDNSTTLIRQGAAWDSAPVNVKSRPW